MVKNKQPKQDKAENVKVDAAQFADGAMEGEPVAASESVEAEEAQVSGVADEAAYPESQDEAFRKRIHDLEVEVKDNKNKVLYHMAECQNVRERASRDVENAHRYGTEKLLNELLPVLDSLERGMEECQGDDAIVKSLHHGMELTHKMFLQVLGKFNVEQVSPLGQAFNSELHEAISVREDKDSKESTVIEVMQKGYVLNGRLVRPALVVVSKK
jgi:molecular chaperone GrpE